MRITDKHGNEIELTAQEYKEAFLDGEALPRHTADIVPDQTVVVTPPRKNNKKQSKKKRYSPRADWKSRVQNLYDTSINYPTLPFGRLATKAGIPQGSHWQLKKQYKKKFGARALKALEARSPRKTASAQAVTKNKTQKSDDKRTKRMRFIGLRAKQLMKQDLQLSYEKARLIAISQYDKPAPTMSTPEPRPKVPHGGPLKCDFCQNFVKHATVSKHKGEPVVVCRRCEKLVVRQD